MKRAFYPGLNIQHPISQLILEGIKTIETRTYPLPKQYIGKEMLLIETPGPTGKFKARIVAKIVIDDCFLYQSEAAFYKDEKHHQVNRHSPWKWVSGKPKWGWRISVVKKFASPFPAPSRRGIKFTKKIELLV